MPYQPFDLSGKAVVITGGNRGIGLGMTEALSAAGANVAIWATNQGTAEAAAEKAKPALKKAKPAAKKPAAPAKL